MCFFICVYYSYSPYSPISPKPLLILSLCFEEPAQAFVHPVFALGVEPGGLAGEGVLGILGQAEAIVGVIGEDGRLAAGRSQDRAGIALEKVPY